MSKLATTFNINGYISYFSNQGKTTRLAFLVLNNIYHSLISSKAIHPNIGASGLTIHGTGSDLDIFNVYIHPGSEQSSITNTDFCKIIANCNQDIIVLCDFNSKNLIWGSPIACNRGRVVEQFMEESKLISLNDGLSIFIHMGFNTPSWLVITLVPEHIVSKCVWEVINDLNSDHLPVLTQYKVNNAWRNISTRKPKWNLNKANWPLFKSLCGQLKMEDFKTNNTDNNNNNLISKIILIADITIPLSALTNRKKAVPWWSTEIGNLIKDRNKSRSIMGKTFY